MQNMPSSDCNWAQYDSTRIDNAKWLAAAAAMAAVPAMAACVGDD